MKKKIWVTTAIALSLLTASFPALAARPIQVQVNGTNISFSDAQPYLDAQQRVQLPLRFVSETLGAKVAWNAANKQATITLGSNTLVVQAGSKSYKVNGKSKTSDTAAVYRDSRIFVPLKVVAEGLGVGLNWDQATGTVSITAKNVTIKPAPSPKPGTYEAENPKEANVHGFKVRYVKMAPNEQPGYITNSQMTVWQYPESQDKDRKLFSIMVVFLRNGSDPIKGMQEADAVLRQKVEGKVVDEVMKYVKRKSHMDIELSKKKFESKDYLITVSSRYHADIEIALYPK
ncbi:copper amine oxidase N-terminal domain-containing protein [Paenibacillus sp. CN-4]|uniref:copper amine oxidase N-terminal domain-containing protein n=1 Tax=Paenibacillus nanchangensis TaxID=3348343 RepID=UPI00397B1384